MLRSFSRLLRALLLGLIPLCSFSQNASLFLVETSHATYAGPTKPELGFLIKDDAGTFIIKNSPKDSFRDPLLRVNPLGLPAGQTFSTRTLKGTYESYPRNFMVYEATPPASFTPLSLASQPPAAGAAVKVWVWDSARRAPVELSATVADTPNFTLRLSRRVEQREIIGAPVCNVAGEVFGIGYQQSTSDQLQVILIPQKWRESPPARFASGPGSGDTSALPSVWRTWEFDGKTQYQAVALSLSPAGDAVDLGLWHQNKWLQRPMPLSRLSAADTAWLKAMGNSSDRSDVPISRATQSLVIDAPAAGKLPWSLTKPPRRPSLEINGVLGTVTFRARTSSADRVFLMTDPTFGRAVKTRTLDQLINQPYVKYTKLGTLTVPAKLVNFPLLGQEDTGTCYVSHYREWLVYYLGDRAPLLPCLEDLRTYLNFLLCDNPSVSELVAGKDIKSTKAFNADTLLARKQSRDFLNNVAFFCRNVLIGAETMPYAKFNDIDGTYQSWKFTNNARQFSEAQFGSLLEGLLLGHMTLGESKTHVMNIIGIDDDRLSVCTWAREYEGTLKELALIDRRGPVLAPTVFEQFPVVARNHEGRVVIPALVPAVASSKLSALQLKAVERFNLGPSGKRSASNGSK